MREKRWLGLEQKKRHREIYNADVGGVKGVPYSWEDYLTSLPKKKRHELKRKIRRIEQNADFTTGDLNSIDQKEEIINEFFRLHKISSSEKNTFMTTKMEKFFTDLIIKMLMLSLLRQWSNV